MKYISSSTDPSSKRPDKEGVGDIREEKVREEDFIQKLKHMITKEKMKEFVEDLERLFNVRQHMYRKICIG